LARSDRRQPVLIRHSRGGSRLKIVNYGCAAGCAIPARAIAAGAPETRAGGLATIRGVSEMTRRLLALSLLLLLAGLSLESGPAAADDKAAPPTVSGIFLTTQYPALTVRVGETATIDLALRNYRLPPQQLALSVPQAPAGWKATILGGGQPIAAAIVTPDSVDSSRRQKRGPANTGSWSRHGVRPAISNSRSP
jgi:hypothetical protein